MQCRRNTILATEEYGRRCVAVAAAETYQKTNIKYKENPYYERTDYFRSTGGSRNQKERSTGCRQKSELFHTEDWLAVWIGIFVIGAAAIGVLTGAYDFSAAKFSTWGNGVSFLSIWSVPLVLKLVFTAVVLGVLFTIGNQLKGTEARKYIPAFAGIFLSWAFLFCFPIL